MSLSSELEKTLMLALTADNERYKRIVKEEIDSAASRVYSNVLSNTPIRTGGLKSALKINNYERNRYGYYISFEGYNNNDVPYLLIARRINKRNRAFMKVPSAGLKGLSQRIEGRWLATSGPG
jgi:hypothetical protein